MPTSPPKTRTQGPSAPLMALLPWLAFEATLGTSPVWAADEGSLDLAGFLISAPIYVGFVAVPSCLPIVASNRAWLRWVVTAVMALIAIAAAAIMVVSDDAQAGLAVFVVSYVAIPLAIAIVVGQLLVDWVRLRARSA